MNKISINLLPGEVLIQEKDKLRKKIFVRISITILLIMIVISSAVLAWRIYQNSELGKTNKQLTDAEAAVSSLKEQETLSFYLKDRMDAIKPLLSGEAKQSESYNLISALVPPSVRMLYFSADKNGNVTLTVLSADTLGVKSFFDKLVDTSANEGKIGKVHMDSLSRGSDNLYRVDLKVNVI